MFWLSKPMETERAMASYEYICWERYRRSWVVEVPDDVAADAKGEGDIFRWIEENANPENSLDDGFFEFEDMIDGCELRPLC